MSDPASIKAKPSRWLVTLLALSLAINLLLIGLFVGAKLRGGPPHGAMLHNSAFSVGRAIRQFDQQRRGELWSLAQPHFTDLRPNIRQLRTAQRRFQQAYAADPIDLTELDAAHAELNTSVASIQAMNFAALRALANELNPTERAALLQALRKPRHRDRQNRDRKDRSSNHRSADPKPDKP